jgi:hypothetical protein
LEIKRPHWIQGRSEAKEWEPSINSRYGCHVSLIKLVNIAFHPYGIVYYVNIISDCLCIKRQRDPIGSKEDQELRSGNLASTQGMDVMSP